MARVSNKISIHKTSDVVLSRFDSDERKCIDDVDKYNITHIHHNTLTPENQDGLYTLSKCLLDASIVKTMAQECLEVVESGKWLLSSTAKISTVALPK